MRGGQSAAYYYRSLLYSKNTPTPCFCCYIFRRTLDPRVCSLYISLLTGHSREEDGATRSEFSRCSSSCSHGCPCCECVAVVPSSRPHLASEALLSSHRHQEGLEMSY